MKSWRTGKKRWRHLIIRGASQQYVPIIFVCQRVKKEEKILNIRSVKGVNLVPLRQCSGAQVSNLSCSGGTTERCIHWLRGGQVSPLEVWKTTAMLVDFFGWYFFNKSLSILMVCLHDLHTRLKRWRENKIVHFLDVFLCRSESLKRNTFNILFRMSCKIRSHFVHAVGLLISHDCCWYCYSLIVAVPCWFKLLWGQDW